MRHEDVWALLRDRRLVPGGRRYMHKIGITEGPLYDWFVDAGYRDIRILPTPVAVSATRA